MKIIVQKSKVRFGNSEIFVAKMLQEELGLALSTKNLRNILQYTFSTLVPSLAAICMYPRFFGTAIWSIIGRNLHVSSLFQAAI